MIARHYTPVRALVSTILLIVGITGCTRSVESDFWKAGASYDLHVKVSQRPTRLPGLAMPATDSLHVQVTIDSTRGDSLFGRYAGRFDSLAVPVGDMGQSPQLVGGRAEADSFSLVLAPNVIDAELVASGKVRQNVGFGAWRKQSPLPYGGAFEIRKANK